MFVHHNLSCAIYWIDCASYQNNEIFSIDVCKKFPTTEDVSTLFQHNMDEPVSCLSKKSVADWLLSVLLLFIGITWKQFWNQLIRFFETKTSVMWVDSFIVDLLYWSWNNADILWACLLLAFKNGWRCHRGCRVYVRVRHSPVHRSSSVTSYQSLTVTFSPDICLMHFLQRSPRLVVVSGSSFYVYCTRH